MQYNQGVINSLLEVSQEDGHALTAFDIKTFLILNQQSLLYLQYLIRKSISTEIWHNKQLNLITLEKCDLYIQLFILSELLKAYLPKKYTPVNEKWLLLK